MFCKKCGKQLPENAKFCGVCGTSVQTEAISKAVPARKVKKAVPAKKLLIGVAALAVVVLLVVLAGSLFGGKTVYLITEIVGNHNEYNEYVTYAYDGDGHLIEYSYSSEYKGQDNYSDSWTYEYEDGRIVAAEYENDTDSFELEYIYDKKGNLEAVESDDFEGEVTCDNKGRIVEMEFEGDREVSVEYSYHDNGILAYMEYNFYRNGEKSTVHTYEYNEDGNIVERDYKTYVKGKLADGRVETWEYDKKGNPIAYTSKRTNSKGQKLTMECEVIGDEDTKEWVITKLSGDKEAFPSITDYLEKGDTYQEETYDDHGNCIEQVIYGEIEKETTYEYIEFKGPKNYLKPYVTDPQFCLFLG